MSAYLSFWLSDGVEAWLSAFIAYWMCADAVSNIFLDKHNARKSVSDYRDLPQPMKKRIKIGRCAGLHIINYSFLRLKTSNLKMYVLDLGFQTLPTF